MSGQKKTHKMRDSNTQMKKRQQNKPLTEKLFENVIKGIKSKNPFPYKLLNFDRSSQKKEIKISLYVIIIV